MARIEVQTSDLGVAGSTQSDLAARIRDCSTSIRGVASGAGGAAGERGGAQAFDELGDRWGRALDSFAEAVASLATNLGTAADAYTETDASAFGGARR